MRKVSVSVLVGLFLVFLVFLIFKNGFVSLFTKMIERAKDAGDVKTKAFLLDEALSKFLPSLSCP